MAEQRDLVFLWINEGKDGIFKDQSVNFGSEMVFKVTREGSNLTLDAAENPSFIQDFFRLVDGGVDNVTAIVGKNGSGKTRLCRIIANLAGGGKPTCSHLAVIRLSRDKQTLGYEVYDATSNGDVLNTAIPLANSSVVRDNIPDLGVRDAVYYSPIIDLSNLDSLSPNTSYQDVSSNDLLVRDRRRAQQTIERFDSTELLDIARSRDLEMQLTLLESPIGQDVLSEVSGAVQSIPGYRVHLINTKFEARFERRVTAKYLGLVNELFKLANQEEERINEESRSGPTPKSFEEQGQALFTNRFGVYMLRSFCYHLGNRIDLEAIVDIAIESLSSTTFPEALAEFFGAHTFFDPEPMVAVIGLARGIQGSVLWVFPGKGEHTYQMPATAFLKLFKAYQAVKGILLALNSYGHNDAEHQGFLRFDYLWTLSSGEKAYLDLYARLLYARQQYEYRIDSQKGIWPQQLFVILDEGEVGFHPAWQQGYVKRVLFALPKLFGNSRHGTVPRMHLIIATHSPVSLSDVPLNHVVALPTKEQTQQGVKLTDRTFAANIHSLYRHGFFLNTHFMGDFAHDKIQAVMNDLVDEKAVLSDSRRDVIRRTIDMIGEPVLRERLLARLHSRFPEGMSDEEQIRYHQQKIKDIESRKRDADH
jgi:hypothetical protein